MPAAAPAPLFNAEFGYTERDFQTIAGLIHASAGISLPDTKAALVYSRLVKRLRKLGLQSFSDYCALLADPAGAQETQIMLRCLTTNVTRFFREPHHFEDVQRLVTGAASDLRAGGRLRLWSAGCSTGQEPYSMAFAVLSALPDAPQLDVKILASDIDTDVLATGLTAVYDEEQVLSVPADDRSRWFEPVSAAAWRVCAPARSLVSFKKLNLNAPVWPMKGPFQAVFCRNVAIYFDEPSQDRLWRRFAGLMPAGASLYVGHSERVRDPAFATCGLTAYRRTPEGAA